MKKILLIISISIILAPSLSRAQTDTYKLLEPIPCITGVGNCTEGGVQPEIDINSYILYVYKFSIAIAVFLAIVMIIWGGFLYITSETPFKIADGREKIQNAILGLVMVLVSYLILLTIDPRLVNIDSNIPKIEPLTNNQLNALRDFEKQVIDDLKNLNAQNKQKIAENTDKINKLKEENKNIEARINNKELTVDEAIVESIKIEQEIKGLEVENKMIIGENNGATSFFKAVVAISQIQKIKNDENSSGDDISSAYDALEDYIATPILNTTGTTPRPINSPNIIQNQYNIQINELLKTNSNSENIQILEKQRDFYIAQVKEENVLTFSLSSDSRGSVNLKKELQKYQDDLNNEEKIKASGISTEQYKAIIQSRIDRLNQAINSPKT